MPTRRPVLSMLAIASIGLASSVAAAQPVTVFAAASLTNALEEVGAAWKAPGRAPVRFSFAASSTLAKQIEQGAPADLFASADEQWMDYLVERRLVDASSRRDFAANRLVLIVPADKPATIDLKPGIDYANLFAGERIATGDPAHVPVGRYAEQALKSLGAWNAIAPRLVRAESVRAALAFVERGEVAAGIVYATDAAISTRVRVAGTFPPGSHPRIVYPVALVAGRATDEARALFAFLNGPEARAILRRHGFGAP
ncbi:MAG: molybdate ABC transporter substrate-binding protein [Betaproteobacteria bacterium]